MLERVKAVKDNKEKPSFCANAVWYGYFGHTGFRKEIIDLAGWYADANEAPRLTTMQAYDLAYRKIYDALPDCRNCTCM